MKCLYPVRMYRADNGTLHHSPNKIKVSSDFFRPCSVCINCRLTRAQSWAIRMTHETKFHPQNSFLTLTYDEQHLPKNNTLNYPDVVKFVKRLRRRIHSPILFYRVGEYGTSFSRPHYHMILFGYDFREPIKYKGVVNTRTLSSKTDERQYFKSTFATDLWGKGYIDIGNVDYATCMYTAKYITKNQKQSEYGSLLAPEKSSMSKKIPIGTRWIQQYYSDVYPHDYVVMDNKKYPPPRFYDEWLAKNKPSLWEATKKNREDSMENTFPDYYELHAAHVIKLQQQQKFTRDGCPLNLSNDEKHIENKRKILDNLKQGLNYET